MHRIVRRAKCIFKMLSNNRRAVYLMTFGTAALLVLIPGIETITARGIWASLLTFWSAHFTYTYWRHSNWQSSQVGKSLLYDRLIITFLGAYITFALWTRSEFPFYGEFGVFVYAGMAGTIYLMDRQLDHILKGEPIKGSSNDPEREPPEMVQKS